MVMNLYALSILLFTTACVTTDPYAPLGRAPVREEVCVAYRDTAFGLECDKWAWKVTGSAPIRKRGL
jgi:hypothetical protein